MITTLLGNSLAMNESWLRRRNFEVLHPEDTEDLETTEWEGTSTNFFRIF